MQRVAPKCAYCLETFNQDMRQRLTFDLTGSMDERVLLSWHINKCADEDPLHLTYATSERNADDISKEHLAAVTLLHAVHARTVSMDVRALPGVLQIRSDVSDSKQTIRGEGADWGRLTRRKSKSNPHMFKSKHFSARK